jgi:cytochrome c oxidase cbb3-type subunit 3
MGGPNLLRSQTALSDRDGERIIPIIQNGRPGMPAIPLKPEDAKAVAAYVRSVLETIGRQGMPPSVGQAAPSILVGDAAAGEAYFLAKCSGCHSLSGDLRGIGARYSDPKALQNNWVAGGLRGGRSGATLAAPAPRTVTVAVTERSGETTSGWLVGMDHFLVTLELADGSLRTFRRDGDVPRIEIRDPKQAHRALWPGLTDKDMHDVTAYLVTLK